MIDDLKKFDWRTLELEKKDIRPCDHFGCDQEGIFPAPRDVHDLKKHYYFCLEHVKAYNDQWNYLDQIKDQGTPHEDTAPHHPFKKTAAGFSRFFSQKSNDPLGVLGNGDGGTVFTPTPTQKFFSPKTPEGRAFVTLGLSWPFKDTDLKRAYKTLAKKHHPDLNQNDPTAIDKFRKVKEAYELLKGLLESLFGDNNPPL